MTLEEAGVNFIANAVVSQPGARDQEGWFPIDDIITMRSMLEAHTFLELSSVMRFIMDESMHPAGRLIYPAWFGVLERVPAVSAAAVARPANDGTADQQDGDMRRTSIGFINDTATAAASLEARKAEEVRWRVAPACMSTAVTACHECWVCLLAGACLLAGSSWCTLHLGVAAFCAYREFCHATCSMWLRISLLQYVGMCH